MASLVKKRIQYINKCAENAASTGKDLNYIADYIHLLSLYVQYKNNCNRTKDTDNNIIPILPEKTTQAKVIDLKVNDVIFVSLSENFPALDERNKHLKKDVPFIQESWDLKDVPSTYDWINFDNAPEDRIYRANALKESVSLMLENYNEDFIFKDLREKYK